MDAPTNIKKNPTARLCPSGVQGLDDVLGGGLPRECFYLVQGDPGSGKTTLALQFLLEGLRRGEKVFYITLSETRSELLSVAESHGWNLDEIPLLDLSSIESILRPEDQTTVFHPSEFELHRVAQIVLEKARQIEPQRIVFDSLSEFRLIAETPLRYRRQLLNLKQAFARLKSTVLLLDDKMHTSMDGADPHVLSLTHGVVEMEQHSPDYGTSRRRVRVMKLRGMSYREGYHDYAIHTGGLQIFPRLVAAEHRITFKREPVSSGLKELDLLLNGGIDRGTSTLIMGPAGSGKSSLAIQYAKQLAENGARSALFAFDETRGVLLTRCKSLGIDIEKHVDSGMLSIEQVDPAELSPGEFAVRIVRRVEEGCKLVVIDTINGYLNAMPGERYLSNQLHELCSYLNQQGVLTIMTLTQHGMVGSHEAPIDISYLADSVISLRFFEAFGEVRQAISIIKKRSGPHERSIRELRLERGKGINIGDPLKEFQGILTGVPVFRGTADQMMGPGHKPSKTS